MLDRRPNHTTWHGAEIVGEILVEDVPRRNPAPIVRVTVTTTGSEVIRGQCVGRARVKANGCAGTASVRGLTHGAHDAVARAGNHDAIGFELCSSTLNVEREAEAGNLPEAAVGDIRQRRYSRLEVVLELCPDRKSVA